MSNKTWLTLDEVLDIAEKEPDQLIWCISDDMSKDFTITASNIKESIGTFDWNGVKFGFISSNDEEGETTVSSSSEITLAGKTTNTKIEILEDINSTTLVTKANDFMHGKTVVLVQYSVIPATVDNVPVYSVMIQYIVEE